MNPDMLREILCGLGREVCHRVHASLFQLSQEERARVHKEEAEDTIYQIDRHVEDLLIATLEERAESVGGLALVAEGICDGDRPLVLPHGRREEEAAWRVIIDPIDGTRCIMYDKRSAFFLAGAAPNRGSATTHKDIEVAVMVELPTSRSLLSDVLWAIRGQGSRRFTYHMLEQTLEPQPITHSRSKTILGGFAQICRFFPPGREILARVEEELVEALYPDAPPRRAVMFEDQYTSTGGQIHELLLGHDRFNADLRTGLYRRLAREGKRIGMTCHPYDTAAFLIGIEAGILITDRQGNPFDAPFDTTSSVDWIAYANPSIRQEVEPILQNLLKKHGLLE